MHAQTSDLQFNFVPLGFSQEKLLLQVICSVPFQPQKHPTNLKKKKTLHVDYNMFYLGFNVCGAAIISHSNYLRKSAKLQFYQKRVTFVYHKQLTLPLTLINYQWNYLISTNGILHGMAYQYIFTHILLFSFSLFFIAKFNIFPDEFYHVLTAVFNPNVNLSLLIKK